MNNKYNKSISRFASLISKNEQEKLDDDEFLIKNKVLVQYESKITIPIDEELKNILSFEEFEEYRKREEKPLIIKSLKYNPLIGNEIFSNFYLNSDVLTENKISKIKTEVFLTIDKEQAKKILEKKLIKYIKKLKKNILCRMLMESDPLLDIDNQEFLNRIIKSISWDTDIIDDYLINGFDMNYNHIIFNDLTNLKYNLIIYKFIKNELKKLNEFLPKNNNVYNFNSKIFKSLKSQELFHKILIKEGALNENSKAIRAFKSVAYDIFKIPTTLRNKIFNTEHLYIYADFLNTNYDAKINDKSKFANLNYKRIDRVIEFIKKELKTQSSQNPKKDEF